MLVELLYRAQEYTNTNNFIGITKYEYNLRINKNLSRTGLVSMNENLSKTPPGPAGINKKLCNPPLSRTKQYTCNN